MTKRLNLSTCCLLFSFICQPVSVYAATYATTKDTTQPRQHPIAQRIITLTPHAAELAFSAGLGNNVIAVSEASDYPEQVLSLPTVANYQGINIERILNLQPDLVIASSKLSSPKSVSKLEQFGIAVFYTSRSSLDTIPNNIESLSLWAEDLRVGQKSADKFRLQLSKIRRENQHKKKVRYFYQLSETPIMSVTNNHWPTEVFETCGGINVLENVSVPYPQVGKEQVIMAQPEAIFTSFMISNKHLIWQDWPSIPAVKTNHIWKLNADWLNRPTLRSLKALDEVCQHLDQARAIAK